MICKQCKKDLPFTEFRSNSEICVDCEMAKNDGLLWCSHRRKLYPRSAFDRTKNGKIARINKISKKQIRDAQKRIFARRKKRVCKKCGGGPTPRDKETNNGNLTDELCSNCFCNPDWDKPKTVEDILNDSITYNNQAQMQDFR